MIKHYNTTKKTESPEASARRLTYIVTHTSVRKKSISYKTYKQYEDASRCHHLVELEHAEFEID
jgi:hypothetical protein